MDYMDYGIDPNGNPTEMDRSGAGSDSGCPRGQRQDAQGNCVPTMQTGGGSFDERGPQYSQEPLPAPQSPQSTFTPQQGATVNLPGWNPTRTDLDPKQAFGQWAQQYTSTGGQWGPDAVRQFVSQDPRWEIDPASGAGDPHIRVKQGELDRWKPGISVWQDVIGDSGGANRIQFQNVPGAAEAAGWRPSMGGPAGQGAGMASFLGGSSAPSARPFQPYTPSSLRAPTEDLIRQMLTSTSLSPSVVAQMKEGSKGSELSMADQLKQQILQNAASRGVSYGGQTAANLQNVDLKALADISGGYRDIDIQKAMRDRQDQERAAALSGQYQQGLFDEYMGQQQLQEQAQQDAFNQWLAQMGFGEGAREFDINNQLAVARFLAGA